jgi:hypothetical protein
MKKLITIGAVVGLMLSFASLAWADTAVNAPPDAPSWWNEECDYYAYGWWEANITGGEVQISPPDDSDHWASNFLTHDQFTAVIGIANETVSVDLDNVFRSDLYKEIYVYITGTTEESVESVNTDLDTDDGVFSGHQTWNIDGEGNWSYELEGEIHPQPDFVSLTFTVPGMTGVTDIWAGENCVPEPATLSLLALGGLGLLLGRKRQ